MSASIRSATPSASFPLSLLQLPSTAHSHEQFWPENVDLDENLSTIINDAVDPDDENNSAKMALASPSRLSRRRATANSMLQRGGTFRRKQPAAPIVSIDKPPLYFYLFRRAYIKMRAQKSGEINGFGGSEWERFILMAYYGIIHKQSKFVLSI